MATGPDRFHRPQQASGGFVDAPIDRLDRPIDLSPIVNLLFSIVDECRPQQIWLFGSRARGEATSSSDWDLLVVVPDASDPAMLDPRFAWRLRKRAGIRADVFLCTASDFLADQGTPNTLLFDVLNEGVLIYER